MSWLAPRHFLACAYIWPLWCLCKGCSMSRVPMSFSHVMSFSFLGPCDGCPSSLQQARHPEPRTKAPVNPNPACLPSRFSSWSSFSFWNIFYFRRYLYFWRLETVRGAVLIYHTVPCALTHTSLLLARPPLMPSTPGWDVRPSQPPPPAWTPMTPVAVTADVAHLEGNY